MNLWKRKKMILMMNYEVREFIFMTIFWLMVIYGIYLTFKEAKERTREQQKKQNQHMTPEDFEEWCADLFRSKGFKVEVTPKVNDGGYDLYMEKDGISYIVECKCYSDTTIGRPLLQKLVGANATIRADKCVFITTSSFSAPAKQYAQEQRIWLIDGNQLENF